MAEWWEGPLRLAVTAVDALVQDHTLSHSERLEDPQSPI